MSLADSLYSIANHFLFVNPFFQVFWIFPPKNAYLTECMHILSKNAAFMAETGGIHVMRKLRTALCLLVLIATIPAVIHIKGSLPPDTQPMIERKYGGWSGVLRLWVREDFPVGVDGAAAWLNRCAASFEKRHPGVYIQPEYVDASALSAEGVLPPDMLLFSPGGVDPSRLAALPPEVGV